MANKDNVEASDDIIRDYNVFNGGSMTNSVGACGQNAYVDGGGSGLCLWCSSRSNGDADPDWRAIVVITIDGGTLETSDNSGSDNGSRDDHRHLDFRWREHNHKKFAFYIPPMKYIL